MLTLKIKANDEFQQYQVRYLFSLSAQTTSGISIQFTLMIRITVSVVLNLMLELELTLRLMPKLMLGLTLMLKAKDCVSTSFGLSAPPRTEGFQRISSRHARVNVEASTRARINRER